MTRDRTQLIGALISLCVLVGLVALDASIPPDFVILTGLFSLAPLIACAVVPASGTAAIAALAVVAAVFSGVWNETLGTAQHNVRILNVVIVGAAAVTIAAVRVRREHRFAELSEIAQAAQRAILPVLPGKVAHIATAARYQSAARGALVGGDLYDCYHSDQHIRFLVGDVRGKGIAGVEQAARVIRAFRQSAALRDTLGGVAEEMDDYLADFFGPEEFVTALLVEVTEPRQLQLLSAGHPAPLCIRTDDGSLLDPPTGVPLGLGLGRAPGTYVETMLAWAPGDRLLMYTDGLSEARDRDGEFLPVTPLADRLRSGSVDGAVEEVLDAVSGHVPRGRLEDDLAVVVLEHLPVAAPTSDRATRDAAIEHRPPRGAPAATAPAAAPAGQHPVLVR